MVAIAVLLIPSTNDVSYPSYISILRLFGTRKLKNDNDERVSGYSNDQFSKRLLGGTGMTRESRERLWSNLRKVRLKDIPNSPSVHRPFEKEGPICKGPIFMKENNSVFVVNHYPGNLEQIAVFASMIHAANYTNATEYRTDRFEDLKRISKNTEKETIQEWLPGFIESVGREEAERLLEHVGNPHLAGGPRISPRTAMQQSRGLNNDGEDAMFQGYGEAPAPHVPDNSTGFAACLHVHDDNLFLPQWLAYHAHTLPLRRLIVYNSAGSTASPEPILDRWSGAINSTIWNDRQVYPGGIPKKGEGFLKKDRQKTLCAGVVSEVSTRRGVTGRW